MRTIETENVQFRRFVFASRRYAREKERALSSVIREREPFARSAHQVSKVPRAFLHRYVSTHHPSRAFHLARDLPRDPSSARAARHKFIYARARPLASLARVATAPRDDASSIITTIDRSTATVGVANQSMDADARSRSRSRARDARHAPVDIDVKRFLSHRRHDRRNRSDRRARVLLTTRVETTGCMMPRARPPTDATVFLAFPRFERSFGSNACTLRHSCGCAHPMTRPRSRAATPFAPSFREKARVTFRWCVCVYSWMWSPCVRILTSPTIRVCSFFFEKLVLVDIDDP